MLNFILKKNNRDNLNTRRISNQKFINLNYSIFIITPVILLILSVFWIKYQYFDDTKKFSTLKNSLTKNYGFVLKNVQISGINNIDENYVLNLIIPKKYSNIFDLDLTELYQKIVSNNWIKSVYIERILPDTLKVKIVEKKPVGIWQNKFGNNLITSRGDIISVINENNFKYNLPIIIGKNANKKAFPILEILENDQTLYKNVWSISYVNQRRWNVHFKQGLVILLPEAKVQKAWEKVSLLQKNYNILNLGLIEIDIRNSKQILGKIDFDKNLILKRNHL